MNTIHHLSQYALQELKDSYSEHEIECICRIVYMDVLHYTNIDIHLRKNEILDESFINKFIGIVRLLKSGSPIQYILGETGFAGLRFKSTPSALIPRPETEELVRWVGEWLKPGNRLLDVGRGSGCIGISLARLCQGAHVTGVDISPEAIELARENAILNGVKAEFLLRDILHPQTASWDTYDLIVSNPPYIRESEKGTMEAKVLDHEPHQALRRSTPVLPGYSRIRTDPLTPSRTFIFRNQRGLRPGNDSPADPIWLPEYRITKRFLWQRTNGEK